MSVYNSSAGLNQDESDITIINPSIIDEHPDMDGTHDPQPTTSVSSHVSNAAAEHAEGRHDYIFVDHNPQENAQHLEQILSYYIRDLRQEASTQIDCDRQLVVRIMDLIRPAYPTDQQKMIELDGIMKDIADLLDARHVKQKEKVVKLRAEICELQKMLFISQNETCILTNENSSMATRTILTNDYDQWTEIEGDAKKLQKIVQTQQDQINEIITLISQTALEPISLNPIATPGDEHGRAPGPTAESLPTQNIVVTNTLLKRIQDIAGQRQEPAATNPTIVNHSPGISPSGSLATLTTAGVNYLIEQQEIDPPASDAVIRAPSPIPPQEKEYCPVCHQEFTFVLDTDREAMYDHVEKCLFPAGIRPEPKEYVCPQCERTFPVNEEAGYHQHLMDCFNRE